jgi:hypothetical protein
MMFGRTTGAMTLEEKTAVSHPRGPSAIFGGPPIHPRHSRKVLKSCRDIRIQRRLTVELRDWICVQELLRRSPDARQRSH